MYGETQRGREGYLPEPGSDDMVTCTRLDKYIKEKIIISIHTCQLNTFTSQPKIV